MVNVIHTGTDGAYILEGIFSEFYIENKHSQSRIYKLEDYMTDEQKKCIKPKTKGSSLSRFYRPLGELNIMVSKTSNYKK